MLTIIFYKKKFNGYFPGLRCCLMDLKSSMHVRLIVYKALGLRALPSDPLRLCYKVCVCVCVCVTVTACVLKIHELSKTLLSCVTLLETAPKWWGRVLAGLCAEWMSGRMWREKPKVETKREG